MYRNFTTAARLLQTVRPLVTLTDVHRYGLSYEAINRDYYVWQTNNLNVAQNETIEPKGNTNPGLTDRVTVFKGLPPMARYGKYTVLFKIEDIVVGPHAAPEHSVAVPIPTNVGIVLDKDALAAALATRE